MIRLFDWSNLDGPCELLDSGAVVAIPTDTVYGLAARVDRPEAVATLFRLKGRPSSVALPVLVATPDQLSDLGVELSPMAETLIGALWPGPLTVVLPAATWLAERVGAPNATVGVRQPNDDDLRQLLLRTGPLAVSSANAHGEPPCVSCDQLVALFQFNNELAGVIDGGRRDGPVSSVVDLTATPWQMVRRGAIEESVIVDVLKER